jgi:hypothetical protein
MERELHKENVRARWRSIDDAQGWPSHELHLSQNVVCRYMMHGLGSATIISPLIAERNRRTWLSWHCCVMAATAKSGYP